MECDSDEDVIFCDVDKNSTDQGGSKRKLSVIEISDSDDDSVSASGISLKLHTKKIQEIDSVVKIIKQTFKPNGEIQASLNSPNNWPSLHQILENSVRQVHDFLLIRNKIVESGVIKLLFDVLSVFTHHYSVQMTTDPQPSTSTGISKTIVKGKHKQWRRKLINDNGTGFGSGEIKSSWKPEDVLKKQIQEELHITGMLKVLASFMNPQDDIPADATALPRLFIDLVEQSCLVPVLRSYLRNDSMLDMTKHIPLYRAITLLIRAITTSSNLVHLLMVKQDETDESIAELLVKIVKCTEAYKSRVR
jgi:baculoviral IAP repeat-containing protein 6 (apollon)